MSFTSSLFHSRADCERTQRELFIDIEPEREQQFVRLLQHELPQIGRHADGGPSGNSSGFGSSPNGMPDESRYSSDAKLWIALRKSPRSFI